MAVHRSVNGGVAGRLVDAGHAAPYFHQIASRCKRLGPADGGVIAHQPAFDNKNLAIPAADADFVTGHGGGL